MSRSNNLPPLALPLPDGGRLDRLYGKALHAGDTVLGALQSDDTTFSYPGAGNNTAWAVKPSGGVELRDYDATKRSYSVSMTLSIIGEYTLCVLMSSSGTVARVPKNTFVQRVPPVVSAVSLTDTYIDADQIFYGLLGRKPLRGHWDHLCYGRRQRRQGLPKRDKRLIRADGHKVKLIITFLSLFTLSTFYISITKLSLPIVTCHSSVHCAFDCYHEDRFWVAFHTAAGMNGVVSGCVPIFIAVIVYLKRRELLNFIGEEAAAKPETIDAE